MRSHPHLTTAALCVPAVLGSLWFAFWLRHGETVAQSLGWW